MTENEVKLIVRQTIDELQDRGQVATREDIQEHARCCLKARGATWAAVKIGSITALVATVITLLISRAFAALGG